MAKPGLVIRTEQADARHRKDYQRFLDTMSRVNPQIQELNAEMKELLVQIDSARVRVEGGDLCTRCDSFAVIPHIGKTSLAKRLNWYEKGKPKKFPKTTYSCDVCGDVERVEVEGASTCGRCHNKSSVLVFHDGTYSKDNYQCEVCGDEKIYDS